MPFEKFVPPKPAGPNPKATIRPSGLISFDAASVDRFGLDEAGFGVLFFDPTRKLIGLRLTDDESEEGALKLTRRRRSVSIKAPSFFESYGIPIEQPSRFDVAHDDKDGLITINLQNVRRRRGRRGRGGPAARGSPRRG